MSGQLKNIYGVVTLWVTGCTKYISTEIKYIVVQDYLYIARKKSIVINTNDTIQYK